MPITEKREETTPRLRFGKSRVSLNWTQLGAIINGVSAIDQNSLAIRNRAEAMRFAKEYGFNLDNPQDRDHIVEVHREAVAFIEEFFLDADQRALLSPAVRHPEDVLDLLVYSSNYLNKSNVRQMWACAVLKVMHGIFHIDHDFKLRYFDTIRDQIFNNLDNLIISEGSHHLLRGQNKIRIPLYFYEKKRNKGRKSILLKLLQKPNYVAADIYDHLGIRLIFETKAECLFALQQLRKQHLISVTNIKPFRSRNSLVDLNQARTIFKKYRPLLDARDTYPVQILARMDEELEKALTPTHADVNPHSSTDYQAIQVTARKMVRLPNPAYTKIKDLLKYVGDQVQIPEELTHEIGLEKELTIYFDYEIQLLDRKSWMNTLHGPSSHRAYKERQRQTARKRVLGLELIKYLDEKTSVAEGT